MIKDIMIRVKRECDNAGFVEVYSDITRNWHCTHCEMSGKIEAGKWNRILKVILPDVSNLRKRGLDTSFFDIKDEVLIE